MMGPLTTLGVGGAAKFFCAVTSEKELMEGLAMAAFRGEPHFVLGGGSNLLADDAGYEGFVLHMLMKGVEVSRDGDVAVYDAAAGEDWDTLVERAVTDGCAGVECLAGIPGTVGATPVQNVGAYGQEVAETIRSVRVYDTEERRYRELTAAECGFGYRTSIFNTSARGRYIVTRVRYGLRPGGAPRIAYADLKKRFVDGVKPSVVEVARAVREIRKAKGMLLVEGDADCRSAGSFFKNPVVETAVVERVAAAAGVADADVPRYDVGEGRVKLPAAWLVERAGFAKGFAMGRAGISTKHTLALVNRGGATAAEIRALRDAIQAGVKGKFGVVMEQEPVSLG